MAKSRHARSRFWRDRRGVAALEMAAVAPFLIFVMLICIDFGRAISQSIELTHAVKAGAQYAVTAANAQRLIEDAVRTALPSGCTAPGFLDNRLAYAARLKVSSCQAARIWAGLRWPFFSISHAAL